MKLFRRQALLALGAAGCAAATGGAPAKRSRPSAPRTAGPAIGDARPGQAIPPATVPATAELAAPQAAPTYPLFERFPGLAAGLPVAALGRWPTPLEAVGPFLVKRDDLSAEPYGGGKPRKLEMFFGRALADGRSRVVTFGGVGSHHVAATAIYAKRLGLRCRLELLPQRPTPEVRRVLLTCQRHGAELVLARSRTPSEERGAHTLAIPPGGTSPLGNAGFVNAGLELAAQLRGRTPPRGIYLAVGTLGSAVGLAIGLAAAALPIPIVGVRAASWAAASPRKMRTQFAKTVAWLRAIDPGFPLLAFDDTRFRFENGYLGSGYAEPTNRGRMATEHASTLGLRLDDTYTAKAFAALLDAQRASGSSAGSRPLLFWHTNSHRALSDEGDPNDLPPALRPFATAPEAARPSAAPPATSRP